MSNLNPNDPRDPAHEEDLEDEEVRLDDEDIVEVHEDDGDQPMDEDDDDDDEGGDGDSDGNNDKYDGEIVIGAPQPGEEEALADMERMYEDNTLGSTCKFTLNH